MPLQSADAVIPSGDENVFMTGDRMSGRPKHPAGVYGLTLGILLLLAGNIAAQPAGIPKASAPSVKLPEGFVLTQHSDENLANDIYAMTLDARGRVVVTSRGWVKTLHDDDNDGKADRATVFCETPTGGMGMAFDGNDLIFCGDGWLSRYRDRDADGKADGPPERIIPLAFTEHGGHAPRKGPDGFWYVIAGNDAKVNRAIHTRGTGSLIKDVEAGALLRLPPDLNPAGCEVVAHGFRNPYDIDFNLQGDLFTYDSDVERDFLLPWYTPTRLYHIEPGQHHGWRVTGYMRSWARRDDFIDNVPSFPIGRGSPTGVAVYRHDRFPDRYRNGLFSCDWTFGKVFFTPLPRNGASYGMEREVFLEPTGIDGFAPTDLEVSPDGSLYVSIGGRGTRGSVYRVAYAKPKAKPANKTDCPEFADVDAVLKAPQPLSAWSRAKWEPVAKGLGAMALVAAATDEDKPVPERIRAIEVLAEFYQGGGESMGEGEAKLLVGDKKEEVRARFAWLLGRHPDLAIAEPTLFKLADAPQLTTRLDALRALMERQALGKLRGPVPPSLALNLLLGDPRPRLAFARILGRLPQADRDIVLDQMKPGQHLYHFNQAELTAGLAEVWRSGDSKTHASLFERPLRVLGRNPGSAEAIQADRLIMLALGDFAIANPPIEVQTAYAPSRPISGLGNIPARIESAILKDFPTASKDVRLNEEHARVLAMIEAASPELPGRVASFWTPSSSATSDVHYLVVLSRLRGASSEAVSKRTADALLNLDAKLKGEDQRIKQSWNDRLSELVAALAARDPGLADRLLASPNFASPGRASWALGLDPSHRERAARIFLDAAKADAEFEWNAPMLELVKALPDAQVKPALRAQWSNPALRDALLPRLASGTPDAVDRPRFLESLESNQPDVTRAALGALEKLDPSRKSGDLVPALRLLRRLLGEPRDAGLRKRLTAWLAREDGPRWSVTEPSNPNAKTLRDAYAPAFDAFRKEHPELSAALEGTPGFDPKALSTLLGKVDWSKGRPEKGDALFRQRGCQTCHTGTRALGPDLTGVTGRFSREDLFTAIAAPSRDVAPAFRTTLVELTDGRTVSGLIAFESADGLIVQTGATTTVRVANSDIAARRPGKESLMPSGLLDGFSPSDLADLYGYLQMLK